MKRRRANPELFGLSFLDVLSCALGGVLVLLLLSMHRDAEEAAAAGQRAQTMIGVKGDEQGVVFIFDTSGSMAGPRFSEYRELLESWVMGLHSEKFNIIRFSGEVERWSTPGVVRSTSASRSAAVEFVRKFMPGGGTSTLAAFQDAFRDPAMTMIVFFSDGQPTDATEDDVLAWLARENAARRVHINTVGMGNYFTEQHGEFLRSIADRHGGIFVGR